VFDGTHAGQATVVLQGERVAALHRGPVEIVDGDVVHLPGHTILPGLIDLHVHIRASAGPPAMAVLQDAVAAHFKALLRSGVTTALDLGAERHVVFAYRQRIRDGVLLGPSLLAAGPGLTPTGGHPCPVGRPGFDLCAFVDDPIDAHAVVTDLAHDRPDVVKAILESGTLAKPLPELSRPALEALRATADAAGIPVVVHVAEAADMHKALDAGVRFFAHLPVRDRIDDALAGRLAALGAVVIPTAAVEDARHRASLGPLDEVLGDDAAKDIPEDVLSAWRDPAPMRATPPRSMVCLCVAKSGCTWKRGSRRRRRCARRRRVLRGRSGWGTAGGSRRGCAPTCSWCKAIQWTASKHSATW
jgi:imidazolonepropionase-like amidohydrolase